MKLSEQRNKCYECSHRGRVIGSAHSSCMAATIKGPTCKVPTFDPHGIKNGWAYWPYNFDPVWLLNCDRFEDIKVKKVLEAFNENI